MKASSKNRVRIVASPHPVGEDPSYNGIRLTEEELAREVKLLKGKPILFEHGSPTDDPIGEWLGGFVDKDGRMIAYGDIDTTKIFGTKAVEDIRSGKMKGVSLGLLHYYDSKENKIVFKEVQEISVTKNPALVAPIIAIGKESEDDIKQQEIFNEIGHIRKQKIQSGKNIELLKSQMSTSAENAPLEPATQNSVSLPQKEAADPSVSAKSSLKRPREEGEKEQQQQEADNSLEQLRKEIKSLYEVQKEESDLKEKVENKPQQQTSGEKPGKKVPIISNDSELKARQWFESLKKNGKEKEVEDMVIKEAARNLEHVKSDVNSLKKWLRNVQKETNTDMSTFFNLLEQAEDKPWHGTTFTDGLKAMQTIVTKANNEGEEFAAKDKAFQEMSAQINKLKTENQMFRKYFEKTENLDKPAIDRPEKKQRVDSDVKQEQVKLSKTNQTSKSTDAFYNNWNLEKPEQSLKMATGGIHLTPVADDPLLADLWKTNSAMTKFASIFSSIPKSVDSPLFSRFNLDNAKPYQEE